MSNPYFTDDAHAHKAGMLVGVLVKAGISAWTKTDDDGNFMNEIVVSLDDGPPPIFVEIKVL